MSTAFVTHYDCSRHDTGWNHPDHQGRLPALSRAVYRDMLVLHEHLLDVEGRHATIDELRLVHSADYLARVQGWVADAAREGAVLEPVEGLRVSGATWDASTAAVGCALTGVEVVRSGEAENAFCAIRPSGQDAGAERPGRFGLVNPVAVAARHLLRERVISRVFVLEIGGSAPTGLRALLGDVPAADVVTIDAAARTAVTGRSGFADAIGRTVAGWGPDPAAFVLLSTDFSGLAGDPVGDLGLTPRDYYDATVQVREMAARVCGGRLVSILGGGYDPVALGDATVQHLRALAGLAPA